MSVDYNELLCQAIDTIVSSRLSSLPFDETIVCTVTAVINSGQGKYEVSDGSTVFMAIASTDRSYFVDDKVYVLIPKSDYTQKKTIVGPYRGDNDQPIGYTSPSDKIMELITVCDKAGSEAGEPEWKLIANGGNTITIDENTETIQEPILQTVDLFDKTFTDSDDFDGRITISDGIYIQAKFKSLLDSNESVSGSYGIALELYTSQVDSAEPIAILTLDSKRDMFGNPYGYTVPSMQEVAFRLASANSESQQPLKRIKGYFYQRGNFVDANGFIDIDGGPNLFVSDVKVGLGLHIENISNYTVRLIGRTDDKYTGNTTKKVSLLWINKNDNNKYIGFSDGTFASTTAEIEYATGKVATWPTSEDENEEKAKKKVYYYIEWSCDGAGGVTKKLEGDNYNNKLTIDAPCEPSLSYTSVTATVWRNGIPYRPENAIEFTNQGGVTTDPFANQGVKFILEHGKNSQGFYGVYGEDNKLKNAADKSKERIIQWSWSGPETVETDFWKGAIVSWELPTGATMITYDSKYTLPITIGDEEGEVSLEEARQFKYKIKDIYSPNNINNTITCTVFKSEHAVTASLLLTFQTYGTIGTTYTLTVRPKEDRIFGFTEIGGTGTSKDDYVGELYDKDGKVIEDANVTLSYYSSDTISSFSDDQFNMIKASISQTWNGNRVNLVTYYPITYSADGEYYAEVPTKIIYDSFGKIQSPVTNQLRLFRYNNNEELYGYTWEIKGFRTSSFVENEFEISTQKSGSVKYAGTSFFDSDENKRIYEIEVSNYQYTNTYAEVNDFHFSNGQLFQITFQDEPTLEEYESDTNVQLYVRLKNTETGETKTSTEFCALISKDWQLEETMVLWYHGPYAQSYEIIDVPVLKVPEMFVSNLNKEYLYLVAKNGSNIVWSSPLLLQQYVYQSETLNEWNGSLTIDEEGNQVLAAAGIFGEKTSLNAFTGVVIGDIGHVESGISKSGIIGMQNGTQSFGFLTNGKGFIGPSGKGRIIFDGSTGVIAGGGWIDADGNVVNSCPSDESGTKIDFADGSFSFNDDDGSYLKLDNGKLSAVLKKLEFQVGNDIVTPDAYLEIIDGKITSSVGHNISYYGKAYTYDETTWYLDIDNKDFYDKLDKNEKIEPFQEGTVISVFFENNRDKKEPMPSEISIEVYFKDPSLNSSKRYGTATLYSSNTWDEGETLGMVYGTKYTKTGFYFTSVSQSKITQTANSITLEVTDPIKDSVSKIETRVGAIELSVTGLASKSELEILENKIQTTVEDKVGFNQCVLQYDTSEEKLILSITVNKTYYDSKVGYGPEWFFDEGTLFRIQMDCNPTEVKNKEIMVYLQVMNGDILTDHTIIGATKSLTLNLENWTANEIITFLYDDKCFTPTSVSRSEITQLSDQISAKVENKSNSEKFSWSLKSDGFYLNNGNTAGSNNYVFKCDSTGVDVKGSIEATSGTIGSWTISEKHGIGGTVDTGKGLYGMGLRFKDVFNSTAQEKTCFAIGIMPYGFGKENTDWDSANFRVTNTGKVYCSDIKITGGSCSNVAITGGSCNNTTITGGSCNNTIIQYYTNIDSPELEITNDHTIVSHDFKSGGSTENRLVIGNGEIQVIASAINRNEGIMVMGRYASQTAYSCGISFGKENTYNHTGLGLHYKDGELRLCAKNYVTNVGITSQPVSWTQMMIDGLPYWVLIGGPGG